MSTLTQWIGANGSILALDGTTGVTVRRGVAGLDCPPIVNTLDQRVNFGGAIRVSSRQPEHPVMLPLLLDLNVISMSTIVRAFQGPGTLVASSGRELREVIYEGGLSAPRTVDNGGVEGQTFRKVDIDLIALDPWWYGDVEVAAVTPLTTATGWDAAISWDAVLPWDGGSTVSVVVAGDASVSPRVLAFFDIVDLVVSNGLMGWSMARDVGAVEIITVDSRPGQRGPRVGTDLIGGFPLGPTDWTILTEDSRLFDLPVGTSSIIYSITSSGASGGLQFYWEPRWLSP